MTAAPNPLQNSQRHTTFRSWELWLCTSPEVKLCWGNMTSHAARGNGRPHQARSSLLAGEISRPQCHHRGRDLMHGSQRGLEGPKRLDVVDDGPPGLRNEAPTLPMASCPHGPPVHAAVPDLEHHGPVDRYMTGPALGKECTRHRFFVALRSF